MSQASLQMMQRESAGIPAGPGWIHAAAARIKAFAAATAADDLSAVTVLSGSAAALGTLRQGWPRETVQVGPRFVTLENLAEDALAHLAGDTRSELGCRVELYFTLRRTPWVLASFGGDSALRAADLWQLAGDLRALAAEIIAGGVGVDDARLAQPLYWLGRRGRDKGSAEAQLVAAVVASIRADPNDPVTVRASALRAWAAQARTPLVLLPSAGPQPVLDALARAWQAPVLQLGLDWQPPAPPWVPLLWPELIDADASAQGVPSAAPPLRTRALAWAAAAHQSPVTLVAAASLEEEALVAATEVEAALRDGCTRIALVALDRLSARRTRALLERAQIRVADEAGWRLSTTAAASALMRWYDVVTSDARWVDLLDWLKAPAVFAADPLKPAALVALESVLRSAGVQGGWGPILRALRAAIGAEPPDATDRSAGLRCALGWIESLMPIAQQTRAAARWQSHAEAWGALDLATGLGTALAQDAAGAQVLREVERLRAEPLAGRFVLTEWRAVLADALETAPFVDAQTTSPVAMVSLAGMWLRSFDRVVLVGADAEHLPTAAPVGGLLPTALRNELGLVSAAQSRHAALVTLATLLAGSGPALATWQVQRQHAQNLESAWFARLRALLRAAGQDDPVSTAAQRLAVLAREVTSLGQAMPAPAAPALLPARISAAAYADLIACPYRFFALRMLRLGELDDIADDPEAQRVGQAMHRALQRWHQLGAHAPAGADTGPSVTIGPVASLQGCIEQAFAPLVDELPGYLAAARQWFNWAPKYMAWQQSWQAQGWRFVHAELSLEQPMALADRIVQLTGRLDRVDLAADGAQAVLDYKTGADTNDLARRAKLPDEHPQLAFYAALLPAPPQRVGYVALRAEKPEKMLLESAAATPAVQATELRLALADRLQRIVDGAPLPAHGALATCERCEARGLCRRAHRASASPVVPTTESAR
jgi:ATP-dependent helicase/nuclease subunit B